MFLFFIYPRQFSFFQRLFILIVVLLIPIFPARAIGISPPKIDFGNVVKWNVNADEIRVVRNGATEPIGDILVLTRARGRGSEYFSGRSSVVIPNGQSFVSYPFTIIPNDSADGNYEVQIDFLVQNTNSVSASAGSVVVTGATAVVQFFLPSQGGSVNSSETVRPVISTVTEKNTEIPKTKETVIEIKKEEIMEIKFELPSKKQSATTKKSIIQNLQKKESTEKPLILSFDQTIAPPKLLSKTHPEPTKYYSNDTVDILIENKVKDVNATGYLFGISQKATAAIEELKQTVNPSFGYAQLSDGIYYTHAAEIFGAKVSPIVSRRILIDTTPPVISDPVLYVEPHIFMKSKFSFNVSAVDKTTSVAYFRITTPTDTYMSVMEKISIKRLKKGTYPISIEAVDIVGNVKTERLLIHVQPESEWETVTRLFKTLKGWLNNKK